MKSYKVDEIDHGNILVFPISTSSCPMMALLQKSLFLTFSQTPTKAAFLLSLASIYTLVVFTLSNG